MRGSYRAIGLIVTAAVISTFVPSFRGVCAAAPADRWLEPVKGEIVRRFEAPLGPFAAGHRGIDFSAPVGSEVVASGPGTVTFSGPVADSGLFVTISHDAELQTTYSFMSTVTVVAGQKIGRGEAIGASGNGHPESPAPILHFGVKLAGVYIDPEILLYADPTDISDIISLAPFEDVGPADRPLVQNEDSPLRHIDFKPIQTPDQGFFAGIGGAISGGFSAGFSWIREAPGNFFDWLKSTGTNIKDGFVDASKKAGEIFRAGMTRIGSAVVDAGKWTWKAIKSLTGSVWSGIKFLARAAWAGAKVGARFSLKAFKSWIAAQIWVLKQIVTGVKAAIRWMDRITQVAALAIDAAARALAEGLRDLWRYVKSLPPRLRDWLADKIHDFADSFDGMIDELKDPVTGRRLPGAALVGLVQGVARENACQLEGGAAPPKLPTAEDLKSGASVPPPNDNILVAVAGIGSSTSEGPHGIKPRASVYEGDWSQMGYTDGNVYHFSYKGLESRGSNDEYALHAVYSKEETFKSIVLSARLLDRQIREIHRLNPDKEIDIVAHSQGGLVAQEYITRLYSPKNEIGLDISHFVSISTPHQGADAAQLNARLADNDAGRQALLELETLATKMDWPPPSSQSAKEMAEGSPFIRRLNADWDPTKVPTTTIGASYDLMVTPQQTRLKGASHYTSLLDESSFFGLDLPVPTLYSHGIIVNSMTTKQIIYNTLADTPSPCTGFRDFKAEFVSGETISWAEDGLASTLDWVTETMNRVQP